MMRKKIITFGQGITIFGILALLVFQNRSESFELKSNEKRVIQNNYSKYAKKQTLELFNKIASLKNKYQEQENTMQKAINDCYWLKQNEISYVDRWFPGPQHSYGLTVRTNNFSVYRFNTFNDELSLPIGQSCYEAGKYEFNKVYKIGSRQIEFFKLFDQCDSYGRCNPVEIHAYTKEENSPVDKIWLFYVGPDGRLISSSDSYIF